MDRILPYQARQRRWRAAGLVIAALIVAGIWLLQARKSNAQESGKALTVAAGTRLRTINGRATIIPTKVSAVSAGVDGVVVQISMPPGAKVGVGDELARLANTKAITDLKRAELSHKSAQASARISEADLREMVLDKQIGVKASKSALETAVAELSAYQLLYDKGGISRISLEKVAAAKAQAEADHEFATRKLAEFTASLPSRRSAANSEVESAFEELRQAQSDISALSITAPQAGTVSKLDLKLGQRLASGALVGEIVSGDLQADIEISQDDATALRIGQLVVLTAPQGSVKAKISAILPRATDGAVHAKATLLGATEWLRPDLVCEARVTDEKQVKGLFVRAPAGISANTITAVTVIGQDGEERATDVEFGDRFDDELLVKRGLKAGDRVVDGENR